MAAILAANTRTAWTGVSILRRNAFAASEIQFIGVFDLEGEIPGLAPDGPIRLSKPAVHPGRLHSLSFVGRGAGVSNQPGGTCRGGDAVIGWKSVRLGASPCPECTLPHAPVSGSRACASLNGRNCKGNPAAANPLKMPLLTLRRPERSRFPAERPPQAPGLRRGRRTALAPEPARLAQRRAKRRCISYPSMAPR